MSDEYKDIYHLLRQATVALEVPESDQSTKTEGTGFLVAPRVVATCAHVLARTRSELPASVHGIFADQQSIDLVPVPAWYFGATSSELDLAFLWATTEPRTSHVLLSPTLEPGDSLITYGYPAGMFRAGQSASFQYIGPSRLGTSEAVWEPGRVAGIPVSAGYSGSPILNKRTGAVCGMLSLSDERGSAHILDTSDILQYLPEEAAEAQTAEFSKGAVTWLAKLSDEQIRSGGWRYPGPRLRRYLEAAMRASQVHAYSAVDEDSESVDVASIYIDQLANLKSSDAENSIRVPATVVFDQPEDAIVIGGPGLGKSRLLQKGLQLKTAAWLEGRVGSVVPVRLQAVDLVEPLPLSDLISSGVTADLSAVGIVDAWPAEFFQGQPMSGVRWMILIDGLDDIVDAGSRRSVVAKLAGVAHDSSSSQYQFVVASRPLSINELAPNGSWKPDLYELQPFGAEQLRELAIRLLAGLGEASAAAVERLLLELDCASLSGVAGVPLMATMLCELMAIDPGRPLPTNLVGIYEDFVEALASRQYVPGMRGIYAQAESVFAPYGHEAVQAARSALDRSTELLARLALAKHDGTRETAVDLLASWGADSRPARVPTRRWSEFLSGILRRSGILAERLGDFVFIHETVGDYLAARAAIADQARSFADFEQLFYRWQRPWPGISEEWREPNWNYAYIRFLIVLWPDQLRTQAALRDIAERGGIPACELIAALYADRIVSDKRVLDSASATLARAARKSVGYSYAARRVLALLVQLDATDWLVNVMTTDDADEETRDRAAIALAGFMDSRGADRLAALAISKDRRLIDRLDACVSLDLLHDDRAADFLVIVFLALTSERGSYKSCELVARRLDGQRGAEFLYALASNEAMSQDMRDSAALTLLSHGDTRGAELLVASASQRDQQASLSLVANIAKLRQPGSARLIRLIAENRTLSGYVRLQGAEILANQNNPDVGELLAAIARDPLAGHPARARAVAMLGEMRAKTALRTLMPAGSTDAAVRSQAVRTLIGIADEHDIEILLTFIDDSELTPSIRIAAAQTLDLLGVPEALVRIETALQDDPSIGPSPDQVMALTELTSGLRQLTSSEPRFERSRVELFITLSQWPLRSAARKTTLVTYPQCQDALAAFARRANAGIRSRRAAALALSALGDSRGEGLRAELRGWSQEGDMLRPGTVDACLALVHSAISPWADGGTDRQSYTVDRAECLDRLYSIAQTSHSFRLRRYSAEVLARLGERQGNEILLDFANSSSLSWFSRCESAMSLARADDARGPNMLRSMARNESLSFKARREAVRTLRLIGDPAARQLIRSMSAIPESERMWHGGYHAELDVALGVRAQLELASLKVDLETRMLARQALAHFMDADRVNALLAEAKNPAVRPDHRREAIRSMALQGASDELANIGEDAECDSTVRCWAAEEAGWLGDSRGTEVLVSLVGDQSVDSYTRRRAAQFLLRLGDSRGSDLLAKLATDPTVTVDARLTASQLLLQVDFVSSLIRLASDSATHNDARFNAIDLLASQGDADALSTLGHDIKLPIDARQRALEALHHVRSKVARRRR